jgi:formamidopyrimidine-DNA glycosylase
MLESTRRHGKHLFVRVSGDGWLRLHFGMTGEVRYFKDHGDAPEHTRLRLDFGGGYTLAYRNTRKLGEIGLVDDPDEFVREQGLGPDALSDDLGLRRFRELLENRRGTLKGTLMNQEVLAGIGNVYADEILFRAGLHPEARADRLRDDSVKKVHRSMRAVLKAAIDARVEAERFPRSFLLPDREEGAPCPRCGRGLRKTEVSGRATYYCPRDQRRKT